MTVVGDRANEVKVEEEEMVLAPTVDRTAAPVNPPTEGLEAEDKALEVETEIDRDPAGERDQTVVAEEETTTAHRDQTLEDRMTEETAEVKEVAETEMEVKIGVTKGIGIIPEATEETLEASPETGSKPASSAVQPNICKPTAQSIALNIPAPLRVSMMASFIWNRSADIGPGLPLLLPALQEKTRN